MVRLFLTFLLFALSSTSHAGFFEVGVSGSYRTSFIQDQYKSVADSLTGSLSYYFLDRSAIQLSYTQANRRDTTFIDSGELEVLQIIQTKVFGADFVLNFADRNSMFQPFVKAGVVQLEKIFISQIVGYPSSDPLTIDGLSYSGGVGFRILLTKELSLNFAADAWALPEGAGNESFDTRITGGVSWFL